MKTRWPLFYSVNSQAAGILNLLSFYAIQRELLQRAGRPDYAALANTGDAIVKSFYWYPTTSDPFTTLVTVRGGRIETIERTKKF